MKQDETKGMKGTVPISRRSLLEAIGIAVIAGGTLTGPTTATTGSTSTPTLAQLAMPNSVSTVAPHTVEMISPSGSRTQQN